MERYFLLNIFINILCWIPHASAFKSHFGREFYLGMIPNVAPNNITIDIASEAPGILQLYVPSLNKNRTQTLHKGLTSITVDSSLVKKGSFREQRGIQILTTVPVAVYVTSYMSSSPDTYMALPVTSIGHTYMVASYQPHQGHTHTSDTSIVSAFKNTTVNISNHGIVNLDRLYISQIAQDSDVTGTVVSSTKPVAVISGASCANVPVGSYDCDIVVGQMLPVSLWTNTYIVPPLPPKTGYIVRVQSLETLQVCLQNSTQNICRTLGRNSFQHFRLGSEPTIVYSNGSSTFSVTQYGMSESVDGVGSGPFMTVIPGIKNFASKYSFAVPLVYSKFNNYISVIVKKSDSTGLLLDGIPLHTMYSYTVPKPLDQYVVIVSNVSARYHLLYTRDGTVAFGAFLYGLLLYEGYGTPLGIKFNSGETTTSPKKQKCYHCDEMTSLEECDVVQTCSDTEVCLTEKYTARTGKFYRSGCIDMTKCPNENTTQSERVCLECCHSDYCNNKGCGDYSFPDRMDRGPMCFDCQHVLNDTELCMKVTMCAPDEVCSIEKYRWGSDYHYKMGCTHRLCTPMKRSLLPKRRRRSTPLCSSCCSDDFCNTNCTQTTDGSTGEIIVG